MVADATISDLRIANMALSHLGAARIESLTEGSTESKEVELWLEFTRLQVLQSHDWGFARRRVDLTLHGDQPPTTSNDPWSGVYTYRYVYPGDCVSFRKIQSPGTDAVAFEIETQPDGKAKSILTNQQYAVGVYTFNATYADQYPPHFVVALSQALAANMAMSLTGQPQVKDYMMNLAFRTVAGAAADDLNENMFDPPRDADWVRGRL